MNISLEDLGLAYRKAKVDLYYSSHACLSAIADYESNLTTNLANLQAKLATDDKTWISDPSFLGDWVLAPKSIEPPKSASKSNGLKFSSPRDEWAHQCKQASDGTKPRAEFRIMAKPSLDFHVLSALWMLKVGHIYDAALTDCAYGNRLRRSHDDSVNPLSLGSFKPYLKPFREWRDGGIRAMRDALSAKKEVVALTADVSSFYHKLNPGFMLNAEFNAKANVTLDPSQSRLHELFICALEAWAANTPLKKGLPVGLPASAVVANAALLELDQLIEQQIAPIYYGRYVDDVLLVMENGASFQSEVDLWEWIFARSEKLLRWKSEGAKKEITFSPKYLANSDITFANDKNKVFILSGETGFTLIDSLARQIHERASEWRALPQLPRNSAHVATDLVAATQNDGEVADNLRKADALTMRRAGFAIKLRDFEAYERDLAPDAWKEHRHAFLQAFIKHVLVLPHFFALSIYLPRVIRLATSCEDFELLGRVLARLSALEGEIGACSVAIKACHDDYQPTVALVMERWKQQLDESVRESIVSAFPPNLSKQGRLSWNEHVVKHGFAPGGMPVNAIKTAHARLFSFDLAHMPFRFIGLPSEMVSQRGVPAKKTALLGQSPPPLPASITGGLATLASWIGMGDSPLPYGLAFATRPFNLAELFVVAKDPFSQATRDSMRAVVLGLRGFALGMNMPTFNPNEEILSVPHDRSAAKVGIAVSSWLTNIESWVASVSRMPDPHSFDRYDRLTRLVSALISQPKGARYFILPELALPAHWFMRFAMKLQGRGISLISGIEYLHAGRNRVRHQVWAALSHDGLGFPSTMIYRQDKQRPAYHEEQELRRVGGLQLKPEKTWRRPPIIQHGEFFFAMLVCSELTNIAYRAALRGAVDALFVPEWNPDTETFNALVESAALDIHSFIIQCNDRQYGDSRIRASGKNSWQRDVLRVKGGIADYCVIGEIDVDSLRGFQSSHRSPSDPFKPVPDGFAMMRERRVLPSAK